MLYVLKCFYNLILGWLSDSYGEMTAKDITVGLAVFYVIIGIICAIYLLIFYFKNRNDIKRVNEYLEQGLIKNDVFNRKTRIIYFSILGAAALILIVGIIVYCVIGGNTVYFPIVAGCLTISVLYCGIVGYFGAKFQTAVRTSYLDQYNESYNTENQNEQKDR